MEVGNSHWVTNSMVQLSSPTNPFSVLSFFLELILYHSSLCFITSSSALVLKKFLVSDRYWLTMFSAERIPDRKIRQCPWPFAVPKPVLGFASTCLYFVDQNATLKTYMFISMLNRFLRPRLSCTRSAIRTGFFDQNHPDTKFLHFLNIMAALTDLRVSNVIRLASDHLRRSVTVSVIRNLASLALLRAKTCMNCTVCQDNANFQSASNKTGNRYLTLNPKLEYPNATAYNHVICWSSAYAGLHCYLFPETSRFVM